MKKRILTRKEKELLTEKIKQIKELMVEVRNMIPNHKSFVSADLIKGKISLCIECESETNSPNFVDLFENKNSNDFEIYSLDGKVIKNEH